MYICRRPRKSQDSNQSSSRGAYRCKNVSKSSLHSIASLASILIAANTVPGRHWGGILVCIGSQKW